MEPQEKMDHAAAEQLESDIDDLCKLSSVELRKTKPTHAIFEAVQDIGRRYRELRTPLLLFYNNYLSVIDEYHNEDISLDKALTLLSQRGVMLRESVKKFIANNKAGTNFQEEEKDSTLQILKKNKDVAHKLQTGIMKHNVFVGQAPVLPMIPFDRSKLQRMGVPSDNLSGYTCLNNQTVIGIAHRFIDKLLQVEIDDANEKKAIRLRTGTRRQELFAETVVTYLKKHPEFVVVGNVHPFWDANWWWLVSKKELSTLRSATFGGAAFKVGNWAFAFAGGGADLQHLKKLGPFQKQAEDRHFVNTKDPLTQNPAKHKYL